MQFFHQVVEEDFSAVNQLMSEQVFSDVGLVEDISHYLIEAGGKRLRPLLVLLISRAMGYQGRHHLTLAVIIEFIHSATLLHDDVVDTSQLRRGRPTANSKWGNSPSVLVGDFLYSRAFQMMVAIGDMEIMAILSDTTNLISEGEVRQLLNIGNPKISEDDYFEVIYKKTAALFEGACEAAAVLSQRPDPINEQRRRSLKSYGYHLGMAFQLVDDALDYSSKSECLGKNVGDDLSEGKVTLPLIVAMKNGSSEEKEMIVEAIESDFEKPDQAIFQQIVTLVQNTGALEYTRRQAATHVEQAKSAVSGLADSKYKEALVDLAKFAIDRDH